MRIVLVTSVCLLLAACEVISPALQIPAASAPMAMPADSRRIEIEVRNDTGREAIVSVSRPGSERGIVGVVQPDRVPAGGRVLVTGLVPARGDWAIFAGGAEYMGSVDAREQRAAALRFRLVIQNPDGGYWEWR